MRYRYIHIYVANPLNQFKVVAEVASFVDNPLHIFQLKSIYLTTPNLSKVKTTVLLSIMATPTTFWSHW